MKDKHKDNVDWLAFNRDLMDCLRTQTNHKFSRFDAFMWLIDNIKRGRLLSDDDKVEHPESGFTASFNQLADQWHWSRQSVSKFIKNLDKIAVITHTRLGNYYIFSLNYSSSDKILL